MCKDKWNGLNSNYKRISNFHLSIGHHIPLWDLTMEEHEKIIFQDCSTQSSMMILNHFKEKNQ
jgi:hypothetical protein